MWSKKLPWIIVFFFLLNTHVLAQYPDYIELIADHFLFKSDQNNLLASGNVTGEYYQYKITAPELFIDYNSKTISAPQEFNIVYDDNTISGNQLLLNYTLRRGSARSVSAEFGKTRIYGKEAEISSENIVITGATYTTCSNINKHYHFYAGSLNLYGSNGIVVLTNTIFHFNGVPLLYMPTFIISDPRYSMLRSQTPLPEAGYNDKDGYYIKERIGYYLNKQNTGLVGLEYYEKRGPRYGIGHQYLYSKELSHYFDIHYMPKYKYPDNYDYAYWADLTSTTMDTRFELAHRQYINYQYVSFMPRLVLNSHEFDCLDLFQYKWSVEGTRVKEYPLPWGYKYADNIFLYRSFPLQGIGLIKPGLDYARNMSRTKKWEQLISSFGYEMSAEEAFFFQIYYYLNLFQKGERPYLYDSQDIFSVNYYDIKTGGRIGAIDIMFHYKLNSCTFEALDSEVRTGINMDCLRLGLRYSLINKEIKFDFSIL